MDEKQIAALMESTDPAKALLSAFNEEMTGLRTKNTELLDETKDLKRKYKDVDLEKIATLEQQVKDAASKGTDADKQQAQITALTEKIATTELQLNERAQRAMNAHIETELLKAVTDAGGIPKALMNNIKGMVKGVDSDGRYSVEVVGADGKARTDGNGGLMSVHGLLEEMKGSIDWGFAFKANGTQGGGAANNTNGGANGSKSMHIDKFKALPPTEQMNFSKGGGVLTD